MQLLNLQFLEASRISLKPKIICIEYNFWFGPNVKCSIPYDKNFTWENQIFSCINDPIKRDSLSFNSRKLYKDKFTSDNIYGEFVKFIEKNYSSWQAKE